MKRVFVLTLLALSTMAHAQVRTLAPFTKQVEAFASDRPTNIWIVSARRAQIPTKVEDYQAFCRSTEEGVCSETRVLETRPGFVLNVQYETNERVSDGGGTVTDTLYVAEEAAPAGALSAGRFLGARKANQFFALNVERITRPIRVIDYRRSVLCGSDDIRCEDQLVYRDSSVDLVIITPSVK